MSDSILAAEDKLDHKLELEHIPITRMADNFVIKVGEIFDWIWAALVIVIIGNVILRYVFRSGYIELEELQWHLYAIGWLVGLSSTAIVDAHVRVDVLNEKLSFKSCSMILFATLRLLVFSVADNL